jgi:hypothetical protein
MVSALEPGRRMQHNIQQVAAQRLDGAIERLDQALTDPGTNLEDVVHEVRTP